MQLLFLNDCFYRRLRCGETNSINQLNGETFSDKYKILELAINIFSYIKNACLSCYCFECFQVELRCKYICIEHMFAHHRIIIQTANELELVK